MRIETHFHTSPASGCAFHSPERMLARAAQRGLDAVCMTDHGTLSGFRYLESGDVPAGLLVVPGLECTVKDIDRCLVEDVLLIADDMEVLAHLDRDGRSIGCLDDLLPPFPRDRFFMVWAHPTPCLDEAGRLRPGALELLDLVDALELRNGKRGKMDDMSPDLFLAALERGKRETAGSDAHSVSDVAAAVTVVEGTASTPAELVALLRSGKPFELLVQDWPRDLFTPAEQQVMDRIRFE